jgi:bromodomain adjacent to zinc finger domain protein 1A
MDASSSSALDDEPPHVIGGDLNIPVKDALTKDNPDLYYYWVYLTELERDKSHEKGKGTTKITDQDKRLVGSLIEVQCNMMRLVSDIVDDVAAI